MDKYGMHFSRLPMAAYTIKFVDEAKITALFADDEYKLPSLESPYARYIVYGVLLGAVVVGGVGATVGYFDKEKEIKIRSGFYGCKYHNAYSRYSFDYYRH